MRGLSWLHYFLCDDDVMRFDGIRVIHTYIYSMVSYKVVVVVENKQKKIGMSIFYIPDQQQLVYYFISMHLHISNGMK